MASTREKKRQVKDLILVVDDDESTRRTVSLILERSGYTTDMAATGQEAIDKARDRLFSAALLDIRLPDIEGVDLLAPLKELRPDMATIMVTGYASAENAMQALNCGATAYLTKPLDMEEMLATVRQSLERQRLAIERRRRYEETRRELAELRQAHEELRNCSDRLEQMLKERTRWTQDAREYAESIAAAVREPLLVLDGELRVISANEAYHRTFRVSPQETEGCAFYELGDGQWDIPFLRKTLRGVLPDSTAFEDFEVEREFPGIGRRVMVLGARREREADETQMVLLTIQDVTERKRVEEALREYEELSRSMLESATVGVYIAEGGRFQYVNPQFEQTTGRSRDELVGTRKGDYVHPEDRELVRREATRQLKGHSTTPYEFRFIHKDGRTLWILERVSSIHYSGKVAALGIFMDITERKRADEALREKERRYRLLAENATDVIWTADTDLRLTYVSPSVRNLLGYTAEEVVSRSFADILAQGSAAAVREVVADQLGASRAKRKEGSNPRTLELEQVCKDGSRVWVEATLTLLRDRNGTAASVMGVSRDITERKRAEERVQAFQRHLRSLASQLSLAEERERKRLAAGLHDQVGQPLAAVKMKLGVLRSRVSSGEVGDEIDDIRELVEAGIQETRSLTFELSPPILYELGLEAALEWLAEQTQQKHSIPCTFNDDGQPKPLGDDARGFLFRAVRELLANVVKHAQARATKVSMERRDDRVLVTVEDDGIGFDASETERRMRGFGLFSIRQRLSEFGGSLEVRSAPGRGTAVRVSSPLDLGEEKRQGD